MKALEALRVKIFADGANLSHIVKMRQCAWIKGFTTNPTLMKKAGIAHYETFAKEVLSLIPDRPVSFEVLSDDFHIMRKQALTIASWGKNVYVKIPITNTRRESAIALVRELAGEGVQQNITAVMTMDQVEASISALSAGPSAFISIFAGRIADTGRDPLPMMKKSLSAASLYPQLEFIWASPRELLNIVQADDIGCHAITVTQDILNKIHLLGKELSDYSLETVKMLYEDACSVGYELETA